MAAPSPKRIHCLDAFAPFFSRYLLLEFIAAFAVCTLAIFAAEER
jgi:hypothetical protein